eukprot:2520189-Alexandrium_andersonii.AAC.1
MPRASGCLGCLGPRAAPRVGRQSIPRQAGLQAAAGSRRQLRAVVGSSSKGLNDCGSSQPRG